MSKFLAGAVIGLVVGLLIAPEKGSDLREEIVDTADKWKEKLNRLAGRAGVSVDDLKAFLDKDIDGLSADVKHRIMTILEDAGDMAYSAKSRLSNGVA